MKILWVVNSIPKEASLLLGKTINPFGSWIETSSQMLASFPEIDLTITFPYQVDAIQKVQGTKISYIAFPLHKRKLEYFDIAKEILSDFCYDLVHIHGTELLHAYVMFKVAKKLEIKTVISLQGLMSEVSKCYLSEIPDHVIKRYRLRDVIKKNRLIDQLDHINLAATRELEMIQESSYIIGRTSFDYEVVHKTNPNSSYMRVHESMRTLFYEQHWDISKIKRYQLFLSQAALPIKGLHILLEAIESLKDEFPQIMLHVGGENIFTPQNMIEVLKQPNYGYYIRQLIKYKKLERHVTFCGILSESEVVEQLLSAHIAISSSTIENSSNAIAEAMLCGVPIVASDVGGTSNFIVHGKTGLLYPCYDKLMLADSIRQLFLDDVLCQNLGSNASKFAQDVFDRTKNMQDLMECYQRIIK